MDFCLIAQERFSWLSPDSWVAILQVVIGLGFIIFVHELGHFLVAKACGVKCEKFYVGFDAFDIKIGDFVIVPRRLFHVQWGETEYGIGIIPLGGYVKMLGQDDNPANQAKERERTRLAEGDGDGEGESVDQAAQAAAEQAETLDPRSYPAKSVPQRLAIISAGVVMNLIFAVIFAMTAYGLGARYSPPVIGSTVPGGPAWIADIRPGTRVVQINDEQKPADHLRFKDLQSSILLTGAGQTIRLKCEVPGSQSPVTYELQPVRGIIQIKGTDLATIGIGPSAANRLAASQAVLPGQAASRAEPPLEDGDLIQQVNGVPVHSGHELKAQLALYPEQTVEFTVLRKIDDDAEKTLTIQVPPQLMKTVGIAADHGPIAAIQEGSPAQAAGLQAGDRLLKIDGRPIQDLLDVSREMLLVARESGSVVVTVARPQDDGMAEVDLTITPRLPRSLPESNGTGHLPHAIDEWGVAVEMTPRVGYVAPDSPAAEAGIQTGDVLVSAQFLTDGQPIDPENNESLLTSQTIDFAEMPQIWPFVVDSIQHMRANDSLRLILDRDGESMQVDLNPVEEPGVYNPKRGFALSADEETLQAHSLSEAFWLGLRQTKEDAGTVYRTLKQMLVGRLSPINLRGPGTIAATATQTAMQGLPDFLLFLTLISANLAVVNFLPIPVLDGGHAVFLLYEGIFRRPPPDQLVFILSVAGLFFILGLMMFVITMDVFQWVVF